MPAKLTKAQVAYRKWYKDHGDDFNAERKKRYAEDAAEREKIIKRQREYRKTQVRVKADGRHYRQVKGKKLEVFRISKVSEMIGVDAQSIRLWEKAGKIPHPTIQGSHRYYTLKQVGLMKELAELSAMVRYNSAIRAVAIGNKKIDIEARWAGV